MFLQRQFVPGGAHATELDPALGVTLRFAEPPGPQPLRHVLSNSFGFGGSNTSLLFSTGPEEGA
jgi:3-oxoacyl-[acyl-carrier-protein] synthase-1